MWSFGAVLWEMGCHCGEERLFKGDNMLAVVMAITTCQIRRFPDKDDNNNNNHYSPKDFNEALLPIVESVVVSDPAQRLSADGVLKKFFAI